MTLPRLLGHLFLAWCGGIAACGTTYAVTEHRGWPVVVWAVVWAVLAVLMVTTVVLDRRAGVVR